VTDLQRELKNLRKRVDKNEDKLEQTTEKLEYLSEEVAEDRIKNIYTFADQSERQDFQSNLAKMNCVLITGKIILIPSFVLCQRHIFINFTYIIQASNAQNFRRTCRVRMLELKRSLSNSWYESLDVKSSFHCL